MIVHITCAIILRTILIYCIMNKTISFAIVHFTVAFSLVYLMTGSFTTGGLVAVIEPCVNTLAFHVHEQFWSRRRARSQHDISATGSLVAV